MSQLDDFVSHLSGAKLQRNGSFIACCPAHDDRKPSLAVSVGDKGGLIIKCWSGCSIEDVLNSLGLEWDAVMPPEAIDHHVPKTKQVIPLSKAFQLARDEMTGVAVTAARLAHGLPISEQERLELFRAHDRLNELARLGNA